MSEQPADRITPAPPASVLAAFNEMGFTPIVELGPAWFRDPSGRTDKWQDHLARMLKELQRRRSVEALGPKKFWKTSEFWMATTTLLGLAGGGVAILGGWAVTLEEPWREIVGGGMATAAALIPRAYRFARERAKQLADLEKEKQLSSPEGQGEEA